MRSHTQWLQKVVRVFTLMTALFSISATTSFSQASLFDPTFNIGSGANGTVYGIVPQDDGKVIVGGSFTEISGQPCTNLSRLNADGRLDTTFPQGTDGAIYRMLKQPDGKILVGGAFTNLQGVLRQRIGRLHTNGTVDMSFDAGVAVPEGVMVLTLACQSDEKVLVGTVPPSGAFSFLKRLLPTGELDNSFIQTNVFWGSYILAICIRTNGSILVGGGFNQVNGFSASALALVATNGVLDTEFASPIQMIFAYGSPYGSGIYAMAALSDNSILMGGGFFRDGFLTNKLVLAKLTSSLAWDSSFTIDTFNSEPLTPGYVMAISLQTDGKMILGGNFQRVGG